MHDNKEKRMIADTGYEVLRSVEIGSREVLLAENMSAPDGKCYLKAEYHENGIIGEYDGVVYSPDFLTALEKFTEAIDHHAAEVRHEIETADFMPQTITPDKCYPNEYDTDITGEVVAVKADVLRPEYRRGDMQLVFVTHGGGAMANPRSTSVFCYHLTDGKQARYDRHQIQGRIKEIPYWAREQLDFYQNERKPVETELPLEKNANYTITMRIPVGNKEFVLGENLKAPSPYVTWQHLKGRPGYDLGHYLTDRDKAIKDLNRRANNERESQNMGRSRKPRERSSAR